MVPPLPPRLPLRASRGALPVLVCVGLFASGSGDEVRAQTLPTALTGHDEPVYALDVSADGKWFATAGFDRTVRLWDAATRKPVRVLDGSTAPLLCVAFSPDGRRVVAGGNDNLLRGWDVPLPDPVGTLVGHKGPVTAVATFPDGTLYVTAGADGTVKFWNPADAKIAREIAVGAPVRRIALRPDKTQLAVADATGLLRLFNVADGAPQGVLGAHPGEPTGVVFPAGNTQVLTSGADGFVRRWPTVIPPVRDLPAPTAPVTALVVNSQATLVAVAAADKSVRLYTLSNGTPGRAIEGLPSVPAALAFSPNGAQLAVAGQDKIARVYDANAGMLVKEFPAHAAALACVTFTPNGNELVVGDAGGLLKTYKVADASEVRSTTAHAGGVSACGFLANAARLVTVGADKHVRFWNPADGAEVAKIDVGTPLAALALANDSQRIAVAGTDGKIRLFNPNDAMPVAEFPAPVEAVTSLEFSRDGARLAVASGRGRVVALEAKTGRMLQDFRHHQGTVVGLGFGADHRTLVSGGADKLVRIDTVSTQMVQLADAAGVADLAVHPNGAQHLAVGKDGTFRLTNVTDGATVRELSPVVPPPAAAPGTAAPNPTTPPNPPAAPQPAAGTCVAFAPNAVQCAAGRADKTVLVWNANDGVLQFRLACPADPVALAWSPDSKRLVAALADHALVLFEPVVPNPAPKFPATLSPTQTLVGHTAAVAGLAFQPDQRTLLTGSADGTARLWWIAATPSFATFTSHNAPIYGATFAPDSATVVSCSLDKTVRFWEAATGKALPGAITLPVAVHAIAMEPEGKHFVVGLADNSVRRFDAAKGIETAKYGGAEYPIYTVAVSSDGKRIAAGGQGLGPKRKVLVWNVDSGTPLKILDAHPDDVYRVQFSPVQPNRLLSAGYGGHLHVWDVAAGKSVWTTNVTAPAVVYSAGYVRDGGTLLVAGNDPVVHVLPLPAEAK